MDSTAATARWGCSRGGDCDSANVRVRIDVFDVGVARTREPAAGVGPVHAAQGGDDPGLDADCGYR